MDFAITSFMPQASAPPAPAGGVPGTGAGKSVVRGAAPSSGSGGDLAALFADLVANAGLGIHEAAVEHDRPADSVPVEGEPDAAGEEDNAGLLEGPPSAAWQPPLLPWQWTIEPAVNAEGGGPAADLAITAAPEPLDTGTTDSFAAPIAVPATERGTKNTETEASLPSPVVSDIGDAATPAAAAAAPEAEVVPHQSVSSTLVPQAPSLKSDAPPDAASPAARALARTLASLTGQARPAPVDATPPDPSTDPGSGDARRSGTAAPGAKQAWVAAQFQRELQTDPAAAALASSQFSAVATQALSPGPADDAVLAAGMTRSSVDLSTGLPLPTAADPDLVVRAAVSTIMTSHQPQAGRPFTLETAAGAPDIATEAQRADVPDQIVRAMRVQLKGDVGQVRLQLRPEFLGEVRIDIKVEGDRVNASMQVERADVRHYLETNGPTLRSALAAAGLHLDELTVRDQESSRREAPEDEAEPQRRQAPRRQVRQEAEREFEIPV